jgi:hypothetical protein
MNWTLKQLAETALRMLKAKARAEGRKPCCGRKEQA